VREVGDLLTDDLLRDDEDAMAELVARTRPRLLQAVRELPDAEVTDQAVA
jgi:hypothetical protein